MSLTTAPVTHAETNTCPAGLSPELQKALSRLTEISSLPEITTKIIAIVEDPKSTAQDMHEIIKHDPALASKVLKVVNSAFYGLPTQIANLDRAIVMLGLSAVKNIAMAASLSRMFRPGQLSDKYSARDLWKHCIAVGVCARLLANEGTGHAEEAFVGGLVHDMGLLVEYQLFPEKLQETIHRVIDKPQDFLAVEREIIGADHQQFGNAIATKWKFPIGLRACIAYHHTPDTLQPEHHKVVQTIRVADTICCQNEMGFPLTAAHQEVTEADLKEIGLTEAQVGLVLEALPERIAETEAIFIE